MEIGLSRAHDGACATATLMTEGTNGYPPLHNQADISQATQAYNQQQPVTLQLLGGGEAGAMAPTMADGTGEVTRGRTTSRDGLNEDGDPPGGPNGGESRADKRRRSRKGLDKKFTCPTEGCGKQYSRAEHLYRHQLNRE